MKADKLLFAATFFLFSCGQDYNSNSGDERYVPQKATAGACDGDAGVRYCAAQAIFSKRCFGCHPTWSKYDTAQKWADSGRVSAGSPTSSLLYNKLINAGGDMPQGGPALPDDEFTTIKDWISGMSPAAQGAR